VTVADLFTLSELASYLQRDLDTASATLAQAGAQSLVRGYLQQDVNTQTYTGALLPIDAHGDYWGVYLPQRPVTAVTSVSVSGTTYTLGTGYAWNGFSQWVLLADKTFTTAQFSDDPVAVITYTAGYATVPDPIKIVALSVAARLYDNPRGIRQESIDDYSFTRGGNDDTMAGVGMLSTERLLLAPYKMRAGSVRVR
jgi:hypothetical protein